MSFSASRARSPTSSPDELDEAPGDGRRALRARVGEPAHHPVGGLLALRGVEEAHVADRLDGLQRAGASARTRRRRRGRARSRARRARDRRRSSATASSSSASAFRTSTRRRPGKRPSALHAADDVDRLLAAGRELLDRLRSRTASAGGRSPHPPSASRSRRSGRRASSPPVRSRSPSPLPQGCDDRVRAVAGVRGARRSPCPASTRDRSTRSANVVVSSTERSIPRASSHTPGSASAPGG